MLSAENMYSDGLVPDNCVGPFGRMHHLLLSFLDEAIVQHENCHCQEENRNHGDRVDNWIVCERRLVIFSRREYVESKQAPVLIFENMKSTRRFEFIELRVVMVSGAKVSNVGPFHLIRYHLIASVFHDNNDPWRTLRNQILKDKVPVDNRCKDSHDGRVSLKGIKNRTNNMDARPREGSRRVPGIRDTLDVPMCDVVCPYTFFEYWIQPRHRQ